MSNASTMSTWQKLSGAQLTRSLALYFGGSYALLEVTDIFTDQFGLPDWFFRGVLVLLLIGLPIVVTTALVQGRAQRRRRGEEAESAGAAAPAAEPSAELSPESAPSHWLTWRKAIAGLVVALAVWGFVVSTYMGMRVLGIGPVGSLVAAGVLDERERLIVSDFENNTGDPLLGHAATEAFRIDFRQSPIVTVVDPSYVAQGLARMGRDPDQPLDLGLARELAIREGIKAVVAGEIWPVGTGFALYARLVSAEGDELAAYRETARDSTAIIEALDGLSKRMRERIGESLKTIRANEPLHRVTTPSLEALRKYSQAVRVIEQGDNERGITLLEEAVSMDTAFAMAHRKLGVALSNIGRDPRRAREALTKAYEHRDRLTDRERYLTEGSYHSGVTQDREKAIAAYRSLLDNSPDDTWAMNNLALLYMESRDFRGSEELLSRAIQLDSAGALYYGNLIAVQVAQDKFTEAERTLAALSRTSPGYPDRGFTASALASARFDYETAEQEALAFRETYRSSDLWRLASDFTLAPIAEVQGRLARAEEYVRDAMEIAERQGQLGVYIAAAVRIAFHDAMLRGDQAGALELVDAALTRHPLASLDPLERPYGLLALFYAMLDQPQQARAMISEFGEEAGPKLLEQEETKAAAEGALALAEGRPEEAIARLRKASEGPCEICLLPLLGMAYDAAEQADSVIAVYERYLDTPWLHRLGASDWYALAGVYERLGGLYELRGDTEKSTYYYGRLVELWHDADPELQPRVEAARRAIMRVSADRSSLES